VDTERWLTWLRTGDVPDDWRDHVDDPQDAEARFLEELRAAAPAWQGGRSGLVVDGLDLEGAWPGTTLRVLFRAERRYPRCRFSWRWPLWRDPSGFDDAIFLANLVELTDAADIVLPGESDEVVELPSAL